MRAQPSPVTRALDAVRSWFVSNTFSPAFMTGKWSHPLAGYLVAIVLQVVAVIVTFLLIRVYPAFRFAGALVILEGLFVALTWGAGPNVIATFVGAILLLFLLPPASFSQAVAQEDILGIFLYVGVGLVVSVLASRRELARRSAEDLRARLETIIEAIPDPLFIYNAQGKSIRRNSTDRKKVTGRRTYPGTFVDDVQMYDLRTPSGAPFPVERLPVARALHGETVAAEEMLYRNEDGQDRYVTVNAAPFHNAEGRIEGVVLIWHDVTEARRLAIEQSMYAETQARLALLQMILDELPSSVYLVRGSDARLILANRAATTMWGASWPVGQPMEDFLKENGIRLLSADGRSLEPEQFTALRALKAGEAVPHQQEIIRHADGTTLPVLVNAVALSSHRLSATPTRWTGQPVEDTAAVDTEAIVVQQDVTALKEAERLKDEFLSLAAHELRTPLAVLKGFAQTLVVQTARGKGAELSDWQKEALQEIDQATIRLHKLIDDLLDVTRIQTGRLVLDYKPTNLVELTQRVVKRLQMTTEQHAISLQIPLQHLVAEVDAGRIEQVLGNLIGNAIKYSPKGGPVEVIIRGEAGSNLALLSIRDYGIGIPAHQQAHIFGRFVRADNAQAYGISGTGLGLYLCRELTERHGGRLWFSSTEEQGSTFFVSLPLIPAQE